MTVTYEMIEEINGLGDSRRISYGIAAYAGTETVMVSSIHDITSDKQKLADLIGKCNRLELSLIHLADVIEDFLAE